MAKAKYKIGNMIKYVENATPTFGEVTGVITKQDGHSYLVNDTLTQVEENDVLKVFVERRTPVARKPKATKPRAVRAKPAATTDETQAAA